MKTRPVGLRVTQALMADRNLEGAAALASAAGADFIELDLDVIAAALGQPAPIVPLAPPPADAHSLGLLELEEDVLLDAYAFARGTFEAQLREWRAGVSLAPLGNMAQACISVNMRVRSVFGHAIEAPTPDAFTFQCRAAQALGARVVATGPHWPWSSELGAVAATYGATAALAWPSSRDQADTVHFLSCPDLAVTLCLQANGGRFPSVPGDMDGIHLRVGALYVVVDPGDESPRAEADARALAAATPGVPLTVVVAHGATPSVSGRTLRTAVASIRTLVV